MKKTAHQPPVPTRTGNQKLREAAEAYEQFLHKNPAEREAMEVWASAPLSDTIEPRQP